MGYGQVSRQVGARGTKEGGALRGCKEGGHTEMVAVEGAPAAGSSISTATRVAGPAAMLSDVVKMAAEIIMVVAFLLAGALRLVDPSPTRCRGGSSHGALMRTSYQLRFTKNISAHMSHERLSSSDRRACYAQRVFCVTFH